MERTQTSNLETHERQRLLESVRQLNKDREELDQAQRGFAEARSELDQKRTENEAQRSETGKGQLTGLIVRKDRVVIMLDASASMFSDNLVDIIRYRVSSPNVQTTAPKWNTAKDAAKWAYRRLPDGANYAFLSYNDKVNSEDGDNGHEH